MMTPIEFAQAAIAAHQNAILEVLKGKTVTFNGRTVSREDLSEIRQELQHWETRLAKLQSGRGAGGVRFKVARF